MTVNRLQQPVLYFLITQQFLKIGITGDIKPRLSTYATHSPFPLDRCITYRVPGGIEQARNIEKWFMRWMRDHHIRLSWFNWNDEAAERLEEGMSAVRTFGSLGEPAVISDPSLFKR